MKEHDWATYAGCAVMILGMVTVVVTTYIALDTLVTWVAQDSAQDLGKWAKEFNDAKQ